MVQQVPKLQPSTACLTGIGCVGRSGRRCDDFNNLFNPSQVYGIVPCSEVNTSSSKQKAESL